MDDIERVQMFDSVYQCVCNCGCVMLIKDTDLQDSSKQLSASSPKNLQLILKLKQALVQLGDQVKGASSESPIEQTEEILMFHLEENLNLPTHALLTISHAHLFNHLDGHVSV